MLVVLADLLFWHHTVGLSLALFAAAVFAVATADIRPRRALAGPSALLALGALPVADYLQPLSLTFLAAALDGALAWARRPGAYMVSGWLEGRPWFGGCQGHGCPPSRCRSGPTGEPGHREQTF